MLFYEFVCGRPNQIYAWREGMKMSVTGPLSISWHQFRSIFMLANGLALPAMMFHAVPAAADPSFDCKLARTLDEKTICSNPYLAQIDSLVAHAYRTNETEFQTKKSIVSRSLKHRAECGEDDACIASVQLSAYRAYKATEPWVSNYVRGLVSSRAALLAKGLIEGVAGIPAKHAQCSRTRIKSVTTRFGEAVTYDNDADGTAVTYENGGFVISYDREEGLYSAKEGQPVIMCLLSVPYDCPDGDDRGRFYYTLSLEANADWVVADAHHMCGGA